MVWQKFVLNDGNVIPGIGYGTGSTDNSERTVALIKQAISVGFNHIDTAESYRNEEEAGAAVKESGLARDQIYVTTKYSGFDGLDIIDSFKRSLERLGLEYVDLYLIHHPEDVRLVGIPSAWKVMESIKEQGLAKSIGVSNFTVNQLAILLASARIKPAVNQIQLNPYDYPRQRSVMDYCRKENILIVGFSILLSITTRPGGPLDPVVDTIAVRLGASADQVLLAWARAKGVVAITKSWKLTRLLGYLAASDLPITEDDIDVIDKAGAIGAGGHVQIIDHSAVFDYETDAKTYRIIVALAALLSTFVLCAMVDRNW